MGWAGGFDRIKRTATAPCDNDMDSARAFFLAHESWPYLDTDPTIDLIADLNGFLIRFGDSVRATKNRKSAVCSGNTRQRRCSIFLT
jgi:hypothetical protein